jgi:hypothetical protein
MTTTSFYAGTVTSRNAVTAIASSVDEANASKVAAATSETNAATSATNSATSATNAATSATTAEGHKNAITGLTTATGAAGSNVAYNSGTGVLTVPRGDTGATGANSTVAGPAGPQGASGSGVGDMLKANNLSDLVNASTARTNLGLVIGTNVQAYSSVLAANTSSFTTATASKLSGIETNATADQTAQQILDAVKTVDGTGSGLDADTLDGQEASYFTGYTDTAITNLVNGAPDALNTLDELAAALGDSAAFSTNVTNSIAAKVSKTSSTGAATIPNGTTAQRDASPVVGALRFNSTLASFEGYGSAGWAPIGGAGGATEDVFYENNQTLTNSFVLASSKNAMSTGPVIIASGVSVTISSGSRYVVI